MKGRALRFALWLSAVLLLVVSLERVSLAEAFRAVGRLDSGAIAILVAVNLAAVLFFTTRWWWILKGLGRPVPLLEAAGYRLAAFGVSYFTPGPQVGGEPLQVLLLERRHAAPREDAIASVALDRLVEGVVNFSYLSGAFLFLVRPGPVSVAAALVLVPLLYLVALRYDQKPLARALDFLSGDGRAERLRSVVRASETRAGRFCREKPGFLALAVAASVASFGLMLGEYWLMARFLGMTLSFRGVVLGLTAARVAYLLFFPAALGVFEAGQIAAVAALGFPPELGVSLALLVRARDVLLGATGLSWGAKAISSAK
jgi:glycosyltransferase 2 family protein